ncbi:2b670b3d-c328-4d3b-9541-0ecee8a71e38 [Thermothielavioides terrestris]|uniref:2b670b3d-c328-4d3b-9541-0ecee8a71e38 n=1 Tax=Thermothielavioides terrestris TaxID=2587410 RepID=A0A3S4F3W8_9PEZI|nr:2b670b3d-c328-4d3b-9541-0ecee8a71e38 [Thermothielavioides terrestris]
MPLNRKRPSPLPSLAPPSSIYSQPDPSTVSVPVSHLPNDTAGAAGGPSARRPTSSAFFHPLSTSANPSHPSLNPFAGYYQQQQPDQADALGGYDGAYDRAGAGPAPINLHPPPGSNWFKSKTSKTSSSSSGKSHSSSSSKSSSSSGSSSKRKPQRHDVLKVDASSLSLAARMGIYLMGTTPEKLERAARRQAEKRRAARREARRERRERERVSGVIEEEEEEEDSGDDDLDPAPEGAEHEEEK